MTYYAYIITVEEHLPPQNKLDVPVYTSNVLIKATSFLASK